MDAETTVRVGACDDGSHSQLGHGETGHVVDEVTEGVRSGHEETSDSGHRPITGKRDLRGVEDCHEVVEHPCQVVGLVCSYRFILV